jgi:hypothetical protein
MKTVSSEGNTAGSGQADNPDRLASRVANPYATDPQFRAAEPIPAVSEAARRPGMRLAPALRTLVDGYADRPALGQRAHEPVTRCRDRTNHHAA